MNFIDTFKVKSTETRTDNGGKAYSTTLSPLLDLFGTLSGLREADENLIIQKFLAARNEDKELADKLILYARDIRDGGCGERRIGRILLKTLAELDSAKTIRNLELFVSLGRWDDLFALENTSCEAAMWKLIGKQLNADIEGMEKQEPISLLAKWMPSINASSKETVRLGKKSCIMLHYTEKQYRKVLSSLRHYLQVLEKTMSANEWEKIQFQQVPSMAMLRYNTAFQRHCAEFEEYLEDVRNGKQIIHSGTITPADIVHRYLDNGKITQSEELQWENLPDYFDEEQQVVVMADVSGSMLCANKQPMSASIGLALYAALHNKGAYSGLFMDFSFVPHFFSIDKNKSLEQLIKDIENASWGCNTNLDLAFQEIYNISLESREVPKALVVISDMQIDNYITDSFDEDIVIKWQRMYEEIGLECPKIVFWNVARQAKNVFLSNIKNPNVSYISGYSAAIFKHLTTLVNLGSYAAMEEILNHYQYR